MILALLLLACTGKDDSGPVDTGPDAPLLAPPYLSVVAPVPFGTLKSTCTLTVDLFDAEDRTTPLQTIAYTARGGEWYGTAAEPGFVYQLDLTWDACWNTGEETGTFSSSIFSLEAGSTLVAWYTGTMKGANTLLQTEDYNGGLAEVEFDPGADPSEAFAAVGATATDLGEGRWALGFPEDQPFGEVFTALTAAEGFLWASPDWRREPDWW